MDNSLAAYPFFHSERDSFCRPHIGQRHIYINLTSPQQISKKLAWHTCLPHQDNDLMFRRKEKIANDIVLEVLRQQGLETPLLQRRLLSAWDDVVPPIVARYTGQKFIRNQTLMVKITNPALRADIGMMRTELKNKLNAAVGSQVIAEVKFF